MSNPGNHQAIYHMKKSLLTLHRARNAALSIGSHNAAKDLKKCIDIVNRQIKLLKLVEEDNEKD